MGEGGRQGPWCIGAECCNHIWLSSATHPTINQPTHQPHPDMCPPALPPGPLPHLTLPGSVGS